MAGKTIIVTGSNSGMGLETATVLYNHGATVVMACRSLERAAVAAATITGTSDDSLGAPKGKIVLMQLDLGSMASIKKFADKVAEDIPALDCIAHNAGVAFMKPGAVTAEGTSMIIGTNHFGVFYLDQLLFSKYVTDGTRVVVTSSLSANGGTLNFGPTLTWSGEEYGASKLANVLHAFELNRRLQAARAAAASSSASARPVPLAVSLHPGIVRTTVFNNIGGCAGAIVVRCVAPVFFLSISQGAQTSLHLVTAPHADIATHSGEFFSHCKPSYVSHAQVKDREITAPKLWEASERMIASFSASAVRIA